MAQERGIPVATLVLDQGDNGAGAEFRPDKALVYNDYVRDCLLEAGILPEEVDGIFADNARLCDEIAHGQERQDKARETWLVTERDKARERMRRVRAQRKGDSTYRAANGQIVSTPTP